MDTPSHEKRVRELNMIADSWDQFLGTIAFKELDEQLREERKNANGILRNKESEYGELRYAQGVLDTIDSIVSFMMTRSENASQDAMRWSAPDIDRAAFLRPDRPPQGT